MAKHLFLKFLFFLLVLASTAMAQHNPPFKLTELSYGIYTSKTVARETMSDSSSLTHSVVANQQLANKTDQIPAKIGINFGSEYQLSGNGKDSVRLEIEWVYPREVVDTAKHSRYKSIRYPIMMPANGVNASDYSLDDNFEVIKGTWVLNIYSDNKRIFSRNFYLY